MKNSKTKICFIQTYAYPLFNQQLNGMHGGSELQLYLISKGLSKNKDFNVSFMVGDFGQNNMECIDNVIIYKSPIPKNNHSIIKKFFQAIEYFKLLKKIDADVYFTSTANGKLGLVSIFCKLTNKKHIHRTAHINDVNRVYEKENGIFGKIYSWGLKNSDCIITQAEEHKKLIKINYNKESEVIKNLFIIKNRRTNKSNKESILWVARFEVWKNPTLFLELSKTFKKEKFIMICPYNEGNISEYKNFISRVNKVANLKFIKKVPFNKIQTYFENAKVFVNTSSSEGFPNTFLQAAAGKTPVLSLNVNPDNFLNKYNCGYYCNGDFNILKEKLNQLLTNKIDFKEKSRNIYKYLKTNHNLDINLKKIVRLIKKIKQQK